MFVDTGLLRHHEGDQVMVTFAEHMGVKVIRVDAEARFLKALENETDPERKRKIIGNLLECLGSDGNNPLSEICIHISDIQLADCPK